MTGFLQTRVPTLPGPPAGDRMALHTGAGGFGSLSPLGETRPREDAAPRTLKPRLGKQHVLEPLGIHKSLFLLSLGAFCPPGLTYDREEQRGHSTPPGGTVKSRNKGK